MKRREAIISGVGAMMAISALKAVAEPISSPVPAGTNGVSLFRMEPVRWTMQLDSVQGFEFNLGKRKVFITSQEFMDALEAK